MSQERVPLKRATGRSPAYPFISLEKALERVETLRKAVGKNDTRVVSAMHHWNYGPKSSGGIQTIAALKHFGLLEDFGSGDDRRVKLTELALRILLDERPDSTERDKLIKVAALHPKMHQELWTRWGNQLPVDAEMRHYLILDRDFNENGADDFIAEYKATLAYSGLLDSDSVSPELSDISRAGWSETEGLKMAQPAGQESRGARVDAPVDTLGAKDLKPSVASGAAPSLVMYDNRIRISADVDLEGAKELVKKMNKRIKLLEEEHETDTD